VSLLEIDAGIPESVPEGHSAATNDIAASLRGPPHIGQYSANMSVNNVCSGVAKSVRDVLFDNVIIPSISFGHAG
jgi:hypothetical protein